jgi:hypothetical protein
MGAALDSYVGLTGMPNAIGFTNSEGAFTPELEPLSMSTIQLKSDSAGAIIPLSPSTASNLASLDTTPAADSLTGAAANAALVGDLRTGQYIALENMGANFNDDYQFLDGRTADGSVGLAPDTNEPYSGTKWQVTEVSEGIITLENKGANFNDDYQFLDGRTADGSVGLAPDTNEPYSGTQWQVAEVSEGIITLENKGANPNPDFLFLDGRTADGTVGLAPNTDASYSGTKWKVYDLGSVFGDEVVRIADEQWDFFGNHVYEQDDDYRKEGDEEAWQRIANEYWQTQGINRTDIDTSEEVDDDDNNPWSAAFISWVMQEAGAGDEFNYSQRHANYINQAIEDRGSDAAFIGHPIDEYSLQPGDLIVANRSENDGITVTYDTAVGNDYQAHVDIVVATRPGEIDVIGGNVEESVTLRTFPVNSEGKLINPNDDNEINDFFAVIENRLGAPVA